MRSRSRASLSTISIISIFGVMLGVTALISVISVTGGFQEAFRDKVLGVNSHVLIMTYGQNSFEEYNEVRALVEAEIEGVEGTSPFIFREMMIASENNISGILFKGIDPDLLHTVSDLPNYLTLPDEDTESCLAHPEVCAKKRQALVDSLRFDRYPAQGEKATPHLLLGEALAIKLNVKVGDVVRVVSPQRGLRSGGMGPSSMAPTDRQFRIVGLYNSGFYDYDNKLVIAHYTALQDFFGHKDVVTGVEIKVADIYATKRIRTQLEILLERDHTNDRYRIIDWKDLNHNLFTSLELQKITLTIIMTFIVIVASFNIVGTLIMMVLDKQKEIAILKSMGATDGGIMRVFIFQGLVIGGVGTVLGLALGYGICQFILLSDWGLDPSIYLIDKLPVKMIPLEFVSVGVGALLISFLATLYPSWWAAQLPPVEGLRYE